jgi:hypothetical protein
MLEPTSDAAIMRIARCWAARRAGRAAAKPVLPALSLEARQALHRSLNDRAFLGHFFREGMILKAKLAMHHLEPNLEIVPARGTAIFALRQEDLESGRRMPIRKLQEQAWKYLREKSVYFPLPLSLGGGGSIAGGHFSGQKAFEELLTLIEIARPAAEEAIREGMARIAAGAPDKASAAAAAVDRFFTAKFENDLIYEIKTHAAAALTCFGGAEVVETLKDLSGERNEHSEELNSVARHLLWALDRFSSLSLGVMYGGSVLARFSEDVDLLRHSGAALDIMAEIDRFHDDPKNSAHFREVPTSLTDTAEEIIYRIVPTPLKG